MNRPPRQANHASQPAAASRCRKRRDRHLCLPREDRGEQAAHLGRTGAQIGIEGDDDLAACLAQADVERAPFPTVSLQAKHLNARSGCSRGGRVVRRTIINDKDLGPFHPRALKRCHHAIERLSDAVCLVIGRNQHREHR